MGGMGFVGTTIVQQLAKMKHVEVTDRLDFRTSPEVEPLLRGKKIEFIEADVPYLFPLQSRLARGEFDDVIHLATVTHIPPVRAVSEFFAYGSNVIVSLNPFAHSSPSTGFIS